MPTHWTYRAVRPDEDLQQGDILRPTQELSQVFGQVHPHFTDPKYLSFLVLTQSCDLVRRNGRCSTRYISVAVVRSLAEVLIRLLDTVCPPIQPGVYSERHRPKAEQLLERVFNQNEGRLGLFYLFPDADVGLGEDAVAFLRVSVTFRADHYPLMVQARTGRLAGPFESKLGWLIGNLYSRVATPDWEPSELRTRTEAYLGESAEQGVHWVPEERLRQLRKAGIPVDRLAPADLLDPKAFPVPNSRDLGIERVVNILTEILETADSGLLKRFKQRLENDATLRSTFRR